MKFKLCLLSLLLLAIGLSLPGCFGARHTIVTVDSADAQGQEVSSLMGETDERWHRVYDPETYRWYRAELDPDSGEWVIAESAQENRERILAILEQQRTPITEHPVILHPGLVLVEEVSPTVQRVTGLDDPQAERSWHRMRDDQSGQWYEAYFDEAQGEWRFTPEALSRMENGEPPLNQHRP